MVNPKFKTSICFHGEDLDISLSFSRENNTAAISLICTNPDFDEESSESKDDNSYWYVLDPKSALEMATALREYAKEALAHNQEMEIDKQKELRKFCPF